MDAVKILGELLGNQTVPRGRGANILEGLVKGAVGGGRRTANPTERSYAQSGPANNSPLGGLIRAAVERLSRNQNTQRPDIPRDGDQQYAHTGHYQPSPGQASRPAQHATNPGDCHFPENRDDANLQARMLIRGMVYASKSDGCLDEKEQHNILSRMGHLSRDEIEFLRFEFSRPTDIRAFAREVPRGMEDEVYAISLIAIDLDTNQEARYLHELSHELELSHETVNYIHGQLGVRPLFG